MTLTDPIKETLQTSDLASEGDNRRRDENLTGWSAPLMFNPSENELRRFRQELRFERQVSAKSGEEGQNRRISEILPY
jgi:hypothetical protein